MKYTNEEWKALFKQAEESGLSGKRWCLENNISYGAYKYHRYSKIKTKEAAGVNVNHKLVKVQLSDGDIQNNPKGFDIIIGKASIRVESVGNLDAVASLINLINEA